uniref:Secreted protein n=1 Tax=Heterorhabditis bacteriophora TaxID=37862 RepID=A0A1I7WMP7_HETBA
MQLLSVLLVSAMLGCVSSLQCYICNSITQPDCVDNYEKFLKPCPVKSFGGKLAQKPIACRVYRQSAAGTSVAVLSFAPSLCI